MPKILSMNRSYCYTLLLVLCTIFPLVSCKKDQTLKADITLIDDEDDEPISGAKVVYEHTNGNSSDIIKEEVGTTDEDGKFHFERKIAQADGNNKLRVFADGYENVYTNGVQYDITPGFNNTIEKQVYPSYHFCFSLKNAACFNETDSIWVSDIYMFQPYPKLFTGCVDTTLYFLDRPFTEWNYLKQKTLTFTVKRNGVVTTTQQQVNLIFNQITPINIVL